MKHGQLVIALPLAKVPYRRRFHDKFVLGDFKPDLTFLLDIEVDKGLARSGRRIAAEALHIKQTEDRFENMAEEFHERLRKGFLEIAKKEPQRVSVINAGATQDEISDAIQSIVIQKLK